MSFQLLPSVDKNKIFLVRQSKLVKRLDPTFYKLKFFDFLSTTPFKIEKIGNCIINANSGFGVGRDKQVEAGTGVLQIRPTNLGDYGILKFDKNVFVPSNAIPSKRHFLENGDILFNNTNSQELVGKTAIYFSIDTNPVTYSNHITLLKVNTRIINPKYLWLLLNTYQRNKVFYSICTNWNNQSGVGVDLLKSLKIPVPNIDVQNGIVGKFDAAYTAKKQKEAEAQMLLGGIDYYLLGELGIESPKVEEQNVQNRIFKRKLSVVSGSRLDPYFHKEIFTKDLLEIKKSNFRHGNIMDFFHVTDGTHFTPTYVQKGKKFLSVKNIRPAEIDFEEVKYISDEEHNSLIKRAHPQPNDILLTKVGTIGYAAVIPEKCPDFSIFVSVALLKPKRQDINSNYISELLNSSVIKLQFLRSLKGVGVPDLHLENIRKIKIPIPPIEKQIKIAEHIFSIRNQAKQLQQEAITELEQAKKDVEVMIMGD